MSEEKLSIQEEIMSKIKSGQVKMKPRWYFIAGSSLAIIGLAGLTVASVFLTGLISFSLRPHGPMGVFRFQEMLNNFPWWAVALAAIGIGSGIWILKKYDFSYKKNFPIIVIGFMLAVVIAGWLIDTLGINKELQRRGPMRRFYPQYNNLETLNHPCLGVQHRGCLN